MKKIISEEFTVRITLRGRGTRKQKQAVLVKMLENVQPISAVENDEDSFFSFQGDESTN